MRMLRLLILVLAGVFPAAPLAAASPATVQTSWRLIDYIAVDYSGAVDRGRVISPPEYAEIREFAATVEKQLRTLPKSPAQPSLVSQAGELRSVIDSRVPASVVAGKARRLGADLLKAYPVPLAPPRMPNLARGDELFRSTCATCHGAAGRGDGPMAGSLNPKPVNFTDRSRAQERSVFALQQVIDQGIDGTAMPSFSGLSTEDRWALAFKVGTFAFPAELAAQGKRIWDGDAALRSRIPDLAALAAITPKTLADQIGPDKANAVIAYLRANPSAVQPTGGGSLALTRSKLAESLTAYRAGNRELARRLALSAYLDAFEPLEPAVAARDDQLMRRIETAMGDLRGAIGEGRGVADVESRAQALSGLLDEAQAALEPRATSSVSTFVSALTILLREGVEALLIVIAMIAFLRKAERTDELRFVHAGWIAALVAGLLTWFAATRLISFSGASRELTEGLGGVLAALVLVFVGIWMHGKAHAEAWQQYVRDKLDRALDRRSGWVLLGLTFVVVYREAFETILFYAAIWNDSPAALIAGAGAGALLLGGVALAMLRYSARLPITQFFRYSSILIALLAVVLAGKGIAELQEAGLLGVTPVALVPRIDWLGLQPSVQVVLAQLAAVGALVIGFALNRSRQARQRSG